MYFISPWLEESLAFVTGVVTIFFLVRSKELRQNIWQFLNTPFSKKITKDKYLTLYLLFHIAGYTRVDFLYFKNSCLFN